MKNEDKKVPDAPKRLWVRTNSLIHDSGLTAVGNISFREYWVGHKNKVPKVLINLKQSCIHTFYDALNISDKMKWNGIIRKDFRFAYWAYIKDLVPTIEEGGTK